MSKKFHRGWRRHSRERMLKRAKAIYGESLGRRLANHLKPCSCWMCGNPRRFFKGKDKLTLQERRVLRDQPEEC